MATKVCSGSANPGNDCAGVERRNLFSVIASASVINSVQINLTSGVTYRAALYASSSATDTDAMALVYDFGEFTPGSSGMYTLPQTGTPSFGAGLYPCLVLKGGPGATYPAIDGNESFPVGDLILGRRAFVDADTSIAFPSTSVNDDDADAPSRIFESTITYSASSANASGATVENAGDTASGSIATINRGLRTPTIYEPNNDSVIADATNVRAIVRDAMGGAELLDISTASIVSGVCTIDNDLVGSIGSNVDLELRWTVSGNSRCVSGPLTVINLDA